MMDAPPTSPTPLARSRNWIVAVLGLALVGGPGAYWYIHRHRPNDPSAETLDTRDKVHGSPWFRDVTAESGLHAIYRNGEEADQFTILETLGGGVALIDYDNDGLLDIFVTGGGFFDGPDKKQMKGHPCKLFRNLGQFKFKDVTHEVGLDRVSWWYTHGAAVADYDCDGYPDLLVTGYGRLALFHNEDDGKGGRQLVDVTEKVGLRDNSWSTSAGWGDLNGDGFPDLYVCHYVDWSFANNPFCPGTALTIKRETCGPHQFKPLMHALFHNEKGKSFRNVSAENGFKAAGCGLGVVLADLNDDGKPDIYVANDTNYNFLFLNRAGKLEEKGLLAGVACDETGRPDGSMGVDVADFDGSGRASLWVTNFQNEVHGLYRNLGKETFHNDSRPAGIAAQGQNFVAFGTGFLDVDNDGWDDIVIANGHVWRNPASGSPKQRPILLHNVSRNGSRFFEDRSKQAGPFFQSLAVGRGVAIGDLDNDGWPDLIVSHTNSPVAILRNEAAASLPKTHHWLGLKLKGRNRRDLVGTTVVLEGDTRKLTRFVKGGGSYASANDARILFGLGATEKIRRITVKWSWGQTQTWDNVEPGRYWELTEGDPKAR